MGKAQAHTRKGSLASRVGAARAAMRAVLNVALSVMLATTLVMPATSVAWADEGLQGAQAAQAAQGAQAAYVAGGAEGAEGTEGTLGAYGALSALDAQGALGAPVEAKAAEEPATEPGEGTPAPAASEPAAAGAASEETTASEPTASEGEAAEEATEAAEAEAEETTEATEEEAAGATNEAPAEEASATEKASASNEVPLPETSPESTVAIEPLIRKGPNGLANLDLNNDATLVPTPLGEMTMAAVKQEAAKRDEEFARLLESFNGSSSRSALALALSDGTALSTQETANLNYTGSAHCWFRNDALNDYIFDVEIDGKTYTAYCLDPSLPAPANDWYTYYAKYDPDEARWEITLDTSGAAVHWDQYDTGAGCQRVGGFYLYADGSLYVQKTSADASVAVGNDCFSYEGATFGVYWAYTDFLADEGLEGTEGNHADYLLTTDATGQTPTIDGLAMGEWYVRELVAPKGFAREEDGWTADVKASAATGVTVSTCADKPISDPDGIMLQKVNAKGEAVAAPGDATLEGAKYAFDYYAGYYNTVEEARASGNPTRHWVLRTNEDGRTGLRRITKTDHSLLVEEESDELFYDGAGYATSLLGTLVIYEIEAPVGYLKSNDVFVARFVQDDSMASGGRWEGGSTGEGSSMDYNQADNTVTAKETQAFYHLEVFKTIQGVENEVTPEGIQFDVVYVGTNAQEYGKTYATLTIDETGHASTKDVFAEDEGLPVGTYEVREVESTLPKDENGNYLIQPYSLTSTDEGTNVVATVTFPGEYEPMDVARVDCVDYTTTPPSLEKKDIDTGESISDVEFTLYKYTGKLGMNDGVIATDPTTLSAKGEYWEEVEAVKTNEHGLATFSNQPYGIYMMVETEANYKYLNASETAKELSSADPLDTARIFKVDKNTPATLQTWEDELIRIETNVNKSTIDVTSAGFAYLTQTEAGTDKSNIGEEEYKYTVGFDNGNTNTYADEYWVVDELNMAASPYDLRVTRIKTPVVQNDSKDGLWLLIRTNKSSADAWAPVVETDLHEWTLCDGSSRFDGTGWRYVGAFSSTQSQTVEVNDLGLEADEYITGICLYYGAVEQGFTTTDPLTYMVRATHELSVGTVIPNTATSHITRNWANREGSIGGLDDDDEDNVTTTVIDTFGVSFSYLLKNGNFGALGSWLPQTGDTAFMIALLAFGCALTAGAVVICLTRKKKQPAQKKGSAQ